MKKLLRLEFLPANPDVGLLLLRLWLGFSMLLLHGSGKLQGFLAGNRKFADPLGVGEVPSLLMAIFAEVVCSVLLILGLFGRVAAIFLIVTMAVAFLVAHGAALKGQGNGELAFIYLGGYIALLLAGTGKYSLDRKF